MSQAGWNNVIYPSNLSICTLGWAEGGQGRGLGLLVDLFNQPLSILSAVMSCWPRVWRLDEYRFRVCNCPIAVSVTIYFLVSSIFGVYATPLSLMQSPRLDLLSGSGRGCPGSTCISLWGWKGVVRTDVCVYVISNSSVERVTQGLPTSQWIQGEC